MEERCSVVFGRDEEGRELTLRTLYNRRGESVTILNRGACIRNLKIRDAKGRLRDVVLGYETAEEYLRDDAYLGVCAGRYANRLKRNRLRVAGQSFELAANEERPGGKNTLHGGLRGLNRAPFVCTEQAEDHLCFHYLSPHGESGFPGNLDLKLTYTLTDGSVLRIEYEACSDQDSVINLTNHSYFNLNGHVRGERSEALEIFDHELSLYSDFYTPVDDERIPTGEIRTVEGTPLDFRRSRKLGVALEALRLFYPGEEGLDHNFLLRGREKGRLCKAAELYSETAGLRMLAETSEPAVQIYTASALGARPGKERCLYAPFSGICLETQHCPDSPNQAHFPSCFLAAGKTFYSVTQFSFLRDII